MWQIYSKFKFVPIAKVVNAAFAHRMRFDYNGLTIMG